MERCDGRLWARGFNSSTLVIKAIMDITTSPLDDTPAVHAVVEVFALKNRYDPLVVSGHTNERGNLVFNLMAVRSA